MAANYSPLATSLNLPDAAQNPAQNGTNATNPQVPVPTQTPIGDSLAALGVDVAKLDLSKIGASTDTDLLTSPKSYYDIKSLYSEMQNAREKYILSLQQTPEEVNLQNQLADVRARALAQDQSYDLGTQKISDEVKPMEFITGEKASLEARNNIIKAGLQREETNLINRLGLASEARKAVAEGYKTQSGFLSEDIQFAQKLNEVATDNMYKAINVAFQYDQATREKAAKVIDFLKGTDPTRISDAELTKLAAGIGMDGNTLKGLLQSQWNIEKLKQISDATKAGLTTEQIDSTLNGGNTNNAGNYTADQIAETLKQIESKGNYNAKGASGEFGAYQFTVPTWNQYSKEYAASKGLRESVAPTPENQDAVARFKIQQWLDEGKTIEQIPLMWNGGEGATQNKQGINKFGVPYDTSTYVNNFLSALPKISVQQETGDTLKAGVYKLPGVGENGTDLIFTPKPKKQLTADESKKVSSVISGLDLIDQAEKLYNEAVGGEYSGAGSGILSRAKGAGRLLGSWFGLNQSWTVYQNFLDSNRAPIAKGLKGEVGNLAENEQENALKSFPGKFSSPFEAQQAFKILRQQAVSNIKTLGTLAPAFGDAANFDK